MNLERQLFRAKIESGSLRELVKLFDAEKGSIDLLVAENALTFLKIFTFEDQLFAYAELPKRRNGIPLPAPINALLRDWPASDNAQKWVEMLDIFHDSKPRAGVPWREKENSRTGVGSIIYLRPEKYASYVFYHFQLQEEGRKKFNKYFIIGANETCLFSYQELPALVDPTHDDRLLDTNNSPDNWAELMGEHFQPWPEGLDIQNPWKVMREIYSFSTVLS